MVKKTMLRLKAAVRNRLICDGLKWKIGHEQSIAKQLTNNEFPPKQKFKTMFRFKYSSLIAREDAL
jgi:hypothetical protein